MGEGPRAYAFAPDEAAYKPLGYSVWQAQLRRPTGRRHPVQFVVKLAHGELRREWAVYRTLAAQKAAALAPRLLDVRHVGTTALLFLEWVPPVCAWP
jgi:hypothetical protein